MIGIMQPKNKSTAKCTSFHATLIFHAIFSLIFSVYEIFIYSFMYHLYFFPKEIIKKTCSFMPKGVLFIFKKLLH